MLTETHPRPFEQMSGQLSLAKSHKMKVYVCSDSKVSLVLSYIDCNHDIWMGFKLSFRSAVP